MSLQQRTKQGKHGETLAHFRKRVVFEEAPVLLHLAALSTYFPVLAKYCHLCLLLVSLCSPLSMSSSCSICTVVQGARQEEVGQALLHPLPPGQVPELGARLLLGSPPHARAFAVVGTRCYFLMLLFDLVVAFFVCAGLCVCVFCECKHVLVVNKSPPSSPSMLELDPAFG